DVVVWVAELPPPLVADRLDADVDVLFIRRVLEVEHQDQAGDKQGYENKDRDDRPGRLKDAAAVDLDRELFVFALAFVAEDRPDDAGRDAEEDDEGHGEHRLVKRVGALRFFRRRLWKLE